MAVLGIIVVLIAELAGESCSLESTSMTFVQDMRRGLKSVFAFLRTEADRSDTRDVLQRLGTGETCREVLRRFGAAVSADQVREGLDARDVGAPVRTVQVDNFQPLRVLTWNIAGRSVAQQAPESWSVEDNVVAVQNEVLKRWRPDFVAFQELSLIHI